MSSFASGGEQGAPQTQPQASEPVESLSDMYRSAFDQYSAFEESPDLQRDETVFYELIQQLDDVMERADREGIISSNESVDDIGTATLQFLFLPYFYAKVCGRCPVLARRLHYLTVANGYMHRFVERCFKLRAVSEEDVASMIAEGSKKPLSDADRRMQKIAKFKKERECKQRIEFLRQFIENFTTESTGLDAEVETRELSLLQLQHYARCCVDDVEMNSQEIGLLKHRAEEEALTADGSRLDGRIQQRAPGDSGHSGGPLYAQEEPRESAGISVTRLNKIGDEIVMKRETIKADIFRPHIAPPTMTLEEFADLEVKQALERERAAKENPPAVTRRYRQLEGDGDEDNLDLVDQATMKDREWDDWKADNPKGWGNKNKMG